MDSDMDANFPIKMRRPSSLTQEVSDEIVTLIAQGDYVETAGAKVGISKQSIMTWLKKGGHAKTGIHKEFVDAVTAAQEIAEGKHLAAIDSAAFGYDVTEVIESFDTQGNRVGPKHVKQTRKLDWRAAAWRLQHKNPRRYSKPPDDDTIDKDSISLFMFALINVLQEEIGDDKTQRIFERLEGELPCEEGQSYLVGHRLEISYKSNGTNGTVELSADPYLPTLPASQQHLASEIPGLSVRPSPGQDSLGGGNGGPTVPKQT